ncbi:MAG: hypothetical protein OEQ53_13150, partial [Saprospiraceae bacterium]|nr:hypothetical protein [Saprospiraceae bacterium]
IPGTLPMVAGTGEAPSGVLYYSLEDFGDSRQGSLLVTAWGDNEIQSFKLQKKGSSFTAEAESLVKGARDFYPVGIALDHDGGIIATDWASVSYAVHGQGRIWKIKGIGSYSITAEMAMVANRSATDLVPALLSPDVRLRTKAAEAMVSKYPADLPELIQSDQLSGPAKMSILWSAQSNQSTILPDLLQLGMQEENELLRSAIVRMKVEGNSIADETFFQNVIENDPSPFVVREAIYGLHSKSSFEQVVDFFERDDPFIHIAIIATFGRSENCDFLLDFAKDENAYIRLGALLCLRHSGSDVGKSAIPAFLEDPRMENRIVVLKWIAEDNLKNFRQNVEESFANVSDISPELFEAYVVTFQYLDGEFNQQSHFMEGDEHVSNTFYKRQKFLLSTAKNTNLNDEIRTRALSAVNPNHEDLSLEDLQLFVSESDTGLQIESVRSVGQREEDAAIQILKRVSNDRSLHLDVRMEAVAGLSRTANINELSKSVLLNLLEKESDNLIIREEAIRSLQEQADDPKIKPWIDEYVQSLPATDLTASDAYWRSIAKEEGNPIAGARTFFNKRYQCGSCHRIDGRGGIFGPDLSKVGSNATRERIVESILVPDDVITPVYAGYEVLDSSGQTVVGRLDRDLDSKRHLQMILADGERKAVAYASIAKQSMLENSLMPINLHRLMSPVEFRDLVQYLVDKK